MPLSTTYHSAPLLIPLLNVSEWHKHFLSSKQRYYSQPSSSHYPPCPHERVVVGVDGGDLAEDVVVRADWLLSLLGLGRVVPGVVDHHPPVVEADAEHEGIVEDPPDDGPHLPLPPLQQLSPAETEVQEAREAAVKILLIEVVPEAEGEGWRVTGFSDCDFLPAFHLETVRVEAVKKRCWVVREVCDNLGTRLMSVLSRICLTLLSVW